MMAVCTGISRIPCNQTVTANKEVYALASIRNATSVIAHGMIQYYTGNTTGGPLVGLLPGPYYWWEAGAMWGAMVDYWHYTNDTTYNNITTQALLSQVGPADDYMVPAQMTNEGNDDQAFWGFAVMSAVEHGFPDPASSSLQWLSLVEALWNTQVFRWGLGSCNGGLKWQIFPSNKGYDYKNAISNGGFFQLAARLAHYTGNQTYVDWAEKSYNWTEGVGLIGPRYDVYDGTDDTMNCSSLDHVQLTYNIAIWLYGAAVMYNYTNGSSIWETRTSGLLTACATFFSPFSNSTNIMYEPSCEEDSSCDLDAQSFKAYLARFMWATTQMAPYTLDAITTLLRASATGAAASCSGGSDGVTCGSRWYTNNWDGLYGVGQQMSALEVMQGLLINGTAPPDTLPVVHLATTQPASSTIPVPSRNTATAPSTMATKTGTGMTGKEIHIESIICTCVVLCICLGF